MKKILLTGSSGTVGKKVLDQLLLKKCYDITVFIQKSAKNLKFLKSYINNIQIIYGDLSIEKDFEAINTEFDCIIHLAAIIPPTADDYPEKAYAVNVTGTKNLILNIEKNSPNAFFMYSSSVSVYGDRLNNPEIRTEDPLNPSYGDEYGKTKIEAESLIKNSKLDWTILRLCAIMGIKNHKMSKLMFHMPLSTSIEIATPEDTARAFVNGIEKRKQLSKNIFNLGGGDNCRITYKELLTKSFEIYGLGKLDFPEKTFAEKNFHCGYYADGYQLEKIVNFRNNDLDYYFKMNQQGISSIQRFFTILLKKPIKYFLKKQSEPLKAYKENNTELKKRFFKS